LWQAMKSGVAIDQERERGKNYFFDQIKT